MLEYLKMLNVPAAIVIVIIALSAISTVMKDLGSIWGFIAPKIFGIKTKLSKQKEVEKAILTNQEEIKSIKNTHKEDREHFEKANMDVRVDVEELSKKLDRCMDMQLQMRIEQMRKSILDFGSAICSGRKYSREQYQFIIKMCTTYTKLIEDNNLTNGEAEITEAIILEKFKENIENGGFLEDLYKKEHETKQN